MSKFVFLDPDKHYFMHADETIIDVTGIPITSLARFEQFTCVKSLHLNGCPLADISNLRALPELESLILCRTPISSVQLLKNNTKITRLILDDCLNLESLSGLEKLGKLQELSLRNCTRVRDLEPLRFLSDLRKLDLNGCRVNSLAPISQRIPMMSDFCPPDEVIDTPVTTPTKMASPHPDPLSWVLIPEEWQQNEEIAHMLSYSTTWRAIVPGGYLYRVDVHDDDGKLLSSSISFGPGGFNGLH